MVHTIRPNRVQGHPLRLLIEIINIGMHGNLAILKIMVRGIAENPPLQEASKWNK